MRTLNTALRAHKRKITFGLCDNDAAHIDIEPVKSFDEPGRLDHKGDEASSLRCVRREWMRKAYLGEVGE